MRGVTVRVRLRLIVRVICLFLVTFPATILPISHRHRDPLGSLLDTLKTQQRAACDGDNLILECPQGTKISIQLVIYGRSSPSHQVCPPTSILPANLTEGTCVVKEALRTVQELCQGKQSCSILTSSYTLGVSSYDPCPSVRKYIEVAYKCRPHSFTSRLLCAGDSAQLSCRKSADKGELLAIFSSSFSSVAHGVIYCPVTRKLFEEMNKSSGDDVADRLKKCENTEVTGSLISMCHGKSSCKITAESQDLNAPVCSSLHVFLKTAYACVSEEIFLPKYVAGPGIRNTPSPDLPSNERDLLLSSTRLSSFQSTQKPQVFDSKERSTRTLETSTDESTSVTEATTKKPDTSGKVDPDLLAGFLHILKLLETNVAQLTLLLTATSCLCLSCLLLIIISRLCKKRRQGQEPMDSDNQERQLVDLDTFETEHTILPEPNIMSYPEDDSKKFLSLSRKSTSKSPVSVEDVVSSRLGREARYSTIGRTPRSGQSPRQECDNYLYY